MAPTDTTSTSTLTVTHFLRKLISLISSLSASSVWSINKSLQLQNHWMMRVEVSSFWHGARTAKKCPQHTTAGQRVAWPDRHASWWDQRLFISCPDRLCDRASLHHGWCLLQPSDSASFCSVVLLLRSSRKENNTESLICNHVSWRVELVVMPQ